MRSLRILALGAALAVGAMLTAACPPGPPPGVVYVKARPPVPVSEVVVASPGPDYVWVPGYHRWDGATYVWVKGTWQRPPHAHAKWAAGHWVEHRNGWYWVEGRWK
ncbi:MAG TPA: hypothetical protein VGK26_07135 [Thermoanaerobaculia bacterium]|jgi:hypothetical protein